jgi:glycosyltransferase involved in cell wall biosynthesis
MRTLYISYFGLREPLVQTQVLPYLRQIRDGDVEVNLLTFEPRMRRSWSGEETESWRQRLSGEGIRWLALPYHKKPSLAATLWDIVAGAAFASRLMRRERIDVIHARGHVPAAMGLLVKTLAGGSLIFDIRGFMPEEYVDAGVWPEGGNLYRWTKRVERRLLAAADAFVVLTQAARTILFPGGGDADAAGRPVEVIPCCVDAERFRAAADVSREQAKGELGLEGRRVLAYVGALGGWYLLDEMADYLLTAHERDPTSFSLVLTQSTPALLEDRLRRRGLTDRDFSIRRAGEDDVPRLLRAADAGLSLIKPCYSKRSSSPTKIAEYLASGLPVVTSAGIGDLDALIGGQRLGVLLHRLDRVAYRESLEQLDVILRDGATAERCRKAARDQFDLAAVGGPRYRRLYARLPAAVRRASRVGGSKETGVGGPRSNRLGT